MEQMELQLSLEGRTRVCQQTNPAGQRGSGCRAAGTGRQRRVAAVHRPKEEEHKTQGLRKEDPADCGDGDRLGSGNPKTLAPPRPRQINTHTHYKFSLVCYAEKLKTGPRALPFPIRPPSSSLTAATALQCWKFSQPLYSAALNTLDSLLQAIGS